VWALSSALRRRRRSARFSAEKCEITVEPTVYYSRFMIYLCSETQNRVDKQRRGKLFRSARHDRQMLTEAAILKRPDLLTWSSFMATHELDGNPWSIGTKNCRQPLQWPISSIIQIKLNMRINTDAMLRNCKEIQARRKRREEKSCENWIFIKIYAHSFR
jgi:hypothetical protein